MVNRVTYAVAKSSHRLARGSTIRDAALVALGSAAGAGHGRSFGAYTTLVEEPLLSKPATSVYAQANESGAFVLMAGVLLFRRFQRFLSQRSSRAVAPAVPLPTTPTTISSPAPVKKAPAAPSSSTQGATLPTRPKRKRPIRPAAPPVSPPRSPTIRDPDRIIRQQLYAALSPVLGPLAGKTAQVAATLLDESDRRVVLAHPTTLAGMIFDRRNEFADALRAEGAKLSDVLQAFLREATPPHGTPLADITPATSSECTKIPAAQEVLAQLRFQRGIGRRALRIELERAGFGIDGSRGKGGHLTVYWGGTIVRSTSGRPVVIPSGGNGKPISDGVLAQVIRDISLFLEGWQAPSEPVAVSPRFATEY